MSEHKALAIPFGVDGFEANDVGAALEVCKMISASNMVPEYAGDPAKVLIAMEMGRELGVPIMKMIAMLTNAPKSYRDRGGNVDVGKVMLALDMGARLDLYGFQALQAIAVINGMPTLWGDAMLGRVLRSPEYEDHKEWMDDAAAYCSVKRKGREIKTRSFSWEQAKRAGLLSKQGPWQGYPDRMLQMRARAFALRDTFADELLGIGMAEERLDVVDMDPEFIEAKPDPVAPGRHSLKVRPGPPVKNEPTKPTEPAPEPPEEPKAESKPKEEPKTQQTPPGGELFDTGLKLNPGEEELLGMVGKAETMSELDILQTEAGKRRLRKAVKKLVDFAIMTRRDDLQGQGKNEPGADG